jgi:hypothetical protein
VGEIISLVYVSGMDEYKHGKGALQAVSATAKGAAAGEMGRK